MNPLFYGIAFALLVAALCVAARLLAVRQRKRDVRRRIELEMHLSTHHVGAWMIAVPSGQAGYIERDMGLLAQQTDPPTRIVDVLRNAGGKVVAHLPGPHADREQTARAWLEGVPRRIATVRIPRPRGASPDGLVVLAYAGPEPPPVSRDLGDIQDHL